MSEAFHLGVSSDGFTILTATGNANDWQRWNKPRNCLLVGMLFIGAGGGGGGGDGQADASNAGGGGGGGQGGITRMVIPAFLLPDTLWFQVGRGGAGGIGAVAGTTPATAGASGSNTIVAYYPNSAASLFGSGTGAVNGGGGGQQGTVSAGGAGGTAAVAATTTTAVLLGTLQIVATAGAVGATGNASGGVTQTGTPSTNLIAPGRGGAGQTATPAAGGGGGTLLSNVDEHGRGSNTPILTSVPGVVGGSPEHAPDGIMLTRFRAIPGAGGSNGSGAGAVGGTGGDSLYGCGGGGGGAVSLAGGGFGGAGGAGGRGGDSVVYIWTLP